MSSESPTIANPASERDARGRFRPGNATSRTGGNPRIVEVARLQRALREKVSVEDVVEVLDALRGRALTGDAAAASIWLARVVGPERRTVRLPNLRPIEGAADVADGVRHVVASVASGELDIESAERMLGLLRSASDALVAEDLERRLAKLELRGVL